MSDGSNNKPDQGGVGESSSEAEGVSVSEGDTEVFGEIEEGSTNNMDSSLTELVEGNRQLLLDISDQNEQSVKDIKNSIQQGVTHIEGVINQKDSQVPILQKSKMFFVAVGVAGVVILLTFIGFYTMRGGLPKTVTDFDLRFWISVGLLVYSFLYFLWACKNRKKYWEWSKFWKDKIDSLEKGDRVDLSRFNKEVKFWLWEFLVPIIGFLIVLEFSFVFYWGKGIQGLEYIYLEKFCWESDRDFLLYLLGATILIFSIPTAYFLRVSSWIVRGPKEIKDNEWIIFLVNNMSNLMSLMVFITIGPYLVPLIAEYILAHTGGVATVQFAAWQKALMTLGLFVHCLSLVVINRRSLSSLWLNVVCSIFVLVFVGIFFGFIYLSEDRRNIASAANGEGDVEMQSARLPGFKDYEQPTPDIYKRAKYRIRLSDLDDSLEYAYKGKVKIENNFNATVEKSYWTVDELIAEVRNVLEKEYAGIIDGEDGSNSFRNKLADRIRYWVAFRGPQIAFTEENMPTPFVRGEWQNATLIGYYVIPHEQGESDVKSNFANEHPIQFVSVGGDRNGTEFFERKEFLKDLRGVLSDASIPHVQVIGVADGVPIATNNSKFSSNYELAKARAERTRSFIRSSIESCPIEAEISVVSVSNDYVSELSLPALKEEILPETKKLIRNNDLRASIVVLTETSPALSNVYVKDPLHYSDAITLVDSMFYSMYTVTTTGYGIIPLSGSIKFFTTFENIFELLVIAVLLGIVIGNPPSMRRRDE
ncbi:potassium channel family protein [Desulfovibrio sp. JC022]|uniref:potassium channel family protein n=1 Tax=Desulfovibrio sp. JC022 TaxID=2593642 RepID=UPI0013D69F92|nr:potassium channel family protein [Desulfovibrio sp. JC022]NDV23815.1 two pore domain potassium channel family protein [Desulfovibrio sp. JC022]